MNKRNLNRYVYRGFDKAIEHSVNHKRDITIRWSGAHYIFVKATRCDNNSNTNGECDLNEFLYRLSPYDRQRLEMRED